MRDYSDVFIMVDRIVHKYSQREKEKQSYGSDLVLTQTELRILYSISKNPGTGVSWLAKRKGVTNGAMSQMVTRLVQKQLVRKEVSVQSGAMVHLSLTELGKNCVAEYLATRDEGGRKWCELLETLDTENYNELKEILTKIDQIL